MKGLLAIIVPVVIFTAGAGAAQAQVMREGDYYVIEDASGNKRILGAAGNQMAPVMKHESGRAPKTCANGAYWENSSGDLLSCAGGTRYGLVRPGAGATMSNGKPYPEGAMMLEERS